MRRLLPWILVAVLGAGVIAGAALGESQRPNSGTGSGSFSGQAAAAWVDDVLATTAAAGSAHFSYVSAVKSPDPSYRSTYRGNGVVDFTSGDFTEREVNYQISYVGFHGLPVRPVRQTWTDESIGIGKSFYENLSSSPTPNWAKFPERRDPHLILGLEQASGAESALGGLSGIAPVVSVQDLGPSSVRGASTTRYRVTNQSLQYCLPRGRQISLSLVWPTTLWVDGQGRIVQAASSVHVSSGLVAQINALNHRPAPPPFPSSTTTTILRFSDFGEPVHITAPVLGPNQLRGVSIALKENPPKKGLCRS